MTPTDNAERLPRLPRLTKEQAAVIGAYTGFLCGSFPDFQAYCERIMGRPIWTHEFPALQLDIREAAKPDFLALCHEGAKRAD